jgi:hypothetical protein
MLFFFLCPHKIREIRTSDPCFIKHDLHPFELPLRLICYILILNDANSYLSPLDVECIHITLSKIKMNYFKINQY